MKPLRLFACDHATERSCCAPKRKVHEL
jgi:hypothetical protein